MTDCESIVVGAGVIGLAVARALALRGQDVVVLDRERFIGSETSSRNSEVIHAGIYYPPGSLKAKLCVAGRQMLYDYCRANGIKHRRAGKLIVATDPQHMAVLADIRATAEANGVHDLQLIDKAAALAMEPELSCIAALHSPSTGIIDSHGFMQALEADIQNHAGQIALANGVGHVARMGEAGYALSLDGTEETVTTRNLVLSGGLHATTLAAGLEGETYQAPKTLYAKGNYFSLSRRSPFSRLIYPVPERGGLGVHLTLDLDNRARFGPDVQWIDAITYDVDPERANVFYAAIRTYWPGLPDNALRPDYSGIRPKVAPPGAPNADFILHGPADHGHANLVALYGIESPGLTASLAIGEAVANLLGSSAGVRS